MIEQLSTLCCYFTCYNNIKLMKRKQKNTLERVGLYFVTVVGFGFGCLFYFEVSPVLRSPHFLPLHLSVPGKTNILFWFAGNQSESHWCHYSTAITLSNEH